MKRRSSRRLPRRAIAAAVAFGLVGLLAAKEMVEVGLAELTASQGLFAQMRPENARAVANVGAQALFAGDAARAERLARGAMRSSPFEVAGVRTLGQARNAREPGSGVELMLLAGRLGWRDRPTQMWIVERAVRANAPEIAIERAEALVRLQQDREVVFTLLRLLARDPRGRREVVESLAQDPFWRRDFLSPTTPISSEEVEPLSQILRGLAGTANPPRPVEARYAIDTLAQDGRLAEAYSLYRLLFPARGDGGNLLNDGGFERQDIDFAAGGSSSVFDWRVYSTQGASAGVERSPDGRGQVLYAIAGTMGSARLADQTMMLPPGRYRLAYRVQADSPGALDHLSWVIKCRGDGPRLLDTPGDELSPREWQSRSHEFTVPQGCTGQLLELYGRPGRDAADTEAFFDDVTVTRAS